MSLVGYRKRVLALFVATGFCLSGHLPSFAQDSNPKPADQETAAPATPKEVVWPGRSPETSFGRKRT